MPDDDDRIDEQHIVTALARRHEAADADAREALRRLTTGLLRQFHTGTFDPVMNALQGLLAFDEKDQFAQRAVDWFLVGRRDNPPFPQRPEMRALLEQELATRLGRDATSTELDVVVDALAGAERDLLMAPNPGARFVIAVKLAEAFAAGA